MVTLVVKMETCWVSYEVLVVKMGVKWSCTNTQNRYKQLLADPILPMGGGGGGAIQTRGAPLLG